MPLRQKFNIFINTLILVAAVASPSGAWAAAGPWLDQEQARLRLLAAPRAVGTESVVTLGLQFQLQPGWKIYWRSPGDAGYPPQVDWSGSENLAAAELQWPVAHRFSLFGLETFGYSDEVVLPVMAELAEPGRPLYIAAKVDYLTCKEICIPREAKLTLVLPDGPAILSPEDILIESYRGLVPGDGTAVGLSLERAILTGSNEAPVLELTLRSDDPLGGPDVMIEGPPAFAFGKPEVTLLDDAEAAVLRVPLVFIPDDQVLEGKQLTVTLTDGQRGLEREIVARFAAGAPAGPGTVDLRTLVALLGLAMLGGLILNLMPCVLPVLSLKLLSVVKHGGAARADVRNGFLASAAGILTSFLVLAGAAIGLKALGLTVGWGIQFQQPLFLGAMTVLVSLFACNLFGFFEIALPRRVQDLASLGMPGSAGGSHSGLLGHFATGAFATLLATPCTAPFLGTAVGFALARGPAEILLIFAFLGLGLALPYLLIAALPMLATWLPRPGPWMITLRRILGVALAGTAVWLLSVLATQVGTGPTLAVAGLLIALAAVLRFRPGRRDYRFATPALAGLLALAAALLPGALDEHTAMRSGAPSPEVVSAGWQPLDIARIPALVAEGKTVFVDVTADWCLTCQVNKKLVLDDDPVRGRLAGPGVVTMRGDWTLPNDGIAQYLEGFGRYGIPFDAVYGPGLPQGEALPELLSDDSVLDALERAAGG